MPAPCACRCCCCFVVLLLPCVMFFASSMAHADEPVGLDLFIIFFALWTIYVAMAAAAAARACCWRWLRVAYAHPCEAKTHVLRFNFATVVDCRAVSDVADDVVQTVNGKPVCVACLTNEPVVYVVPCGHLIYCGSCASASPQAREDQPWLCPVCRRQAAFVGRIYYPAIKHS